MTSLLPNLLKKIFCYLARNVPLFLFKRLTCHYLRWVFYAIYVWKENFKRERAPMASSINSESRQFAKPRKKKKGNFFRINTKLVFYCSKNIYLWIYLLSQIIFCLLVANECILSRHLEIKTINFASSECIFRLSLLSRGYS